MNTTIRTAGNLFTAIMAMVLATGCADPESEVGEDQVGTLDSELNLPNGTFINGTFINGTFINGKFINGTFINGTFINGSNLVGWSLKASTLGGTTGNNVKIVAAWLNDGAIYVKGADGVVRSGNNLKNTQVTGALSEDGTIVTMTIEKVESFTAADGDSLQHATISFKIPGSNVKAYVCGLNNGVPLRAIPVSGRWSYDQGLPGGGDRIKDSSAITFACEGYTIYKCISAGYHLWESDLEDHHQACTRLIRADYCGNGKPWTVDGTIVNMYDHIGIQGDTANWQFESEWDEDGAVCVSHQRVQQMGFVPPCSFEKPANKCGKSIKWNKTLLASEAP